MYYTIIYMLNNNVNEKKKSFRKLALKVSNILFFRFMYSAEICIFCVLNTNFLLCFKNA